MLQVDSIDHAPLAPIRTRPGRPRIGLALGGGAARGLAHIGVLEVLEREGLPVHGIAGSSMGALIGALSARGLRSGDIREAARSFRFPRRFVPGRIVSFERLFPSILPILACSFESLSTQLIVTTVDLEAGQELLLHTGSVLSAVRASCAVPGVLPPVSREGRWLVDGSLINVVPVDVAWLMELDVVIAVHVGRTPAHQVPTLDSRTAALALRLGQIVPNPLTGRLLLDLIVRASEIALSRQTALAAAMAEPEVVIEPDLGDIGLRDFERLEDACEAGRRAAERALPELIRALESPSRHGRATQRALVLRFDPVCRMAVSPSRARASEQRGDAMHYFCSLNCRDAFMRDPAKYLGRVSALEPDV